MNIVNVNLLQAAVLLRQLVACGAKRAVISPGSRSTPLALTAHNMPELQTYVLTDERAAGFFALGLSKADGAPAILICTSGTAAANYFPAIIEAAQSCVPLIALTADRPVALRGRGAPQTIEQVHLYGGYPRFFADVPEARLTLDHMRCVRTLSSQAYAAAMSVPAGPAHLNVPMDEPIAPIPEHRDEAEEIWRQIVLESDMPFHLQTSQPPAQDTVTTALKRVSAALCGLIVAGPDAARTEDEAQAIHFLSRRLGWPVLADVTSGLRFFGEPVLPFYDVFLREDSLAALAPDVVLAFGAHPVSNALNAYLDRHRVAHTLRVQPDARGRDPNARAQETVVADVAAFCHALSALLPVSRDSLLYEPFRAASTRLRAALNAADPVLCEAHFVRAAVRSMPADANVILANSLSVRYADALCAAEGQAHRVFGMRGASGIDGTISHAMGIAAASQVPSLLVCGDLAFLHDLNALAAARLAANLTILLLNNDGGGIFHFLPLHGCENREVFEAIHGTPHGLNLAAAADLFDVEWMTARFPADLRSLFDRSRSRLRVIEVRTSRETNARAHAALLKRLQKAAVS
ncbi:MAG: 2-succinyl-5-enolpyruvyl-6-hydroxy-3-cyclohexene-1-carboxylic-acid synthase [bacterium]|nr:2-succinyl-5-enolpyruvyl-6-hydroxy-3-cyclohexene-1-carboxylic-acid synthase [bacterium]